MINYPAGVETCIVTEGAALDFSGDDGYYRRMEITPELGGDAKGIVWAETNTALLNFQLIAEAGPGEVASIRLPVVDQPGFVNGSEETVTGWWYRARITTTKDRNFKKNMVQREKRFQVLAGQTTVDVDAIPDGTITAPVSAPVAPVTSVNGETGAVVVPVGLSEALVDAKIETAIEDPGPARDGVDARVSVVAGPLVTTGIALAMEAERNKIALRHFKAKASAAASRQVNVLTVGTSLTEGQESSDVAHTWPELLIAGLRTAHPSGAAGGASFLPANYVVTNLVDPWTVAAGSPSLGTTYGLNRRHWSLGSSGTVTISRTFTGTGVDIYYARSSTTGTFSWSIDGGAATNVNSNSGATATNDGLVQVRGLSAGAHTLTISRVSGGTDIIGGIKPYDGDETKGFHLWNGGHSGYTSADMIGASSSGQWQIVQHIKPDLVIIEVGANDVKPASAINPDQMIANVAALVAQIRASAPSEPDFVITGVWARVSATASVTEDMWAPYFEALRTYAAAQGFAFLDLWKAFGTNAAATAAGLLSDQTHVTDAGASLMASKALALLAA